MNSSKASIVVSQIIEKIQMIVGIILVGFWGIGLAATITEGDVTVIILCLIFIGLGVWSILAARKRKKLIIDFKTYVQRLSVDPTGSIDNLAAGLGTSQDIVNKRLKLMMKKNYFKDAYIDTDANQVVFSRGNSYMNNAAQTADEPIQKIDYTTVMCKSCGGNNKIVKGTVCECEFCGSPIK